MGIFGSNAHRNGQELRRGLAIEDSRLRGIAALIDLDHCLETGERENGFEQLAEIRTRFQLEPEDMMHILHQLHPGLADLTLPPPDDELALN